MTQEYLSSKINTCWHQEKDGQEGYAVKYKDGYTSWCPKQPFKEGNIALGNISHLPEWHQRLVAEKLQLKDRADKLLTFIQSGEAEEQLPSKQYELLKEQWDAMMHYYTILGSRIELIE